MSSFTPTPMTGPGSSGDVAMPRGADPCSRVAGADPSPARWVPLLVLVLVETAYVAALILDHRIGRGHDTFSYFALQFAFLNNVATAGELPQWMPYTTHGEPANWWFLQQAGILSSLLVPFGGLLQGVNFNGLFLLGLLLDEMVLLAGSWLLSGHLLCTFTARFFTTTTILGTVMWLDQPWFNFHLYYALPLILHFVHVFLETGRMRAALLAVWLFALQMGGNLPYFVPITSMVLVMYAAAALVISDRHDLRKLASPRLARGDIVVGVMAAATLAAAWTLVNHGTESIVGFGQGRRPDGSVDFESFCTFGGNNGLLKWREALLGASPCLDYSLGFGIVGVAALALALVGRPLDRRMLAAGIVAANLVLFSVGGSVTRFWYSLWPMMPYYRHIALVSPVAKLFLCFLAGFGVDSLVLGSHRRWAVFLVATGTGVLAAHLGAFAARPEAARAVIGELVLGADRLPVFKPLLQPEVASAHLVQSAVVALLATLLLVGLAMRRPSRRALVVLLVALQTLDVYGGKIRSTLLKTVRATDEQRRMCALQPAPSERRRADGPAGNRRAAAFADQLGAHDEDTTWARHPFLFLDARETSDRTDHWLQGFDDLMKAYWRQPIGCYSVEPAGLDPYRSLSFPGHHPAIRKVVGVTADKLQVFGTAHRMDSDADVAAHLVHPDFTGDALFVVDATTAGRGLPRPRAQAGSVTPPGDQRLPHRYRVLAFDANTLEVAIDVPGRGGDRSGQTAWLYLADGWHPFWRATVNGLPARIWKANLAYKAIEIPVGSSLVRFRFGSTATSVAFAFFVAGAWAWAGIVLRALGRRLLGRDTNPG